ncbi:hypothetical protein GCM10010446_29970 [Streptomyces enissocaesilis]|uniref:Uncharacterized protein n=1 Tax=Streptomyces enissocaesilis TaxID=332589 RepID=A0ABN3X8N2_9ACTN
MEVSTRVRAAPEAASEGRVFFGPVGIEGRYASLARELPGMSARRARKAWHERGPVHVPRTAAPGDPVRLFPCAAHTADRMARGFNGPGPLPYAWMDGECPEGRA